jgi:FMN phosphatase YigB (HAD superfamily)
MIKHISFDLWDTLYIGNPNFRIARAEYLNNLYGFTPEQVHSAVSATKRLCDDTAEKTMCNIDAVTQAWHLLDNLGCASIQGARDLAEKTHEIFFYNPPVPVFDKNDLISLKDKGLSISISCNTGLISGDSIVSMLQNTGVYDLFDYALFSDHIGYFKPNPFFLQKVLNHYKCKADNFSETLHIGDNKNTDGYMCQLTNSNFLLVERGGLDFSSIQNYL